MANDQEDLQSRGAPDDRQIARQPIPDADGLQASDPNDEIPVPPAMSPAEVDERAQVVEALRGNAPPPHFDAET